MEICKTVEPPRYQVDEDHYVYCHLYDDKVEAQKKKTAAGKID
jgi:hypothetical protein